jgi:hypothetical protein
MVHFPLKQRETLERRWQGTTPGNDYIKLGGTLVLAGSPGAMMRTLRGACIATKPSTSDLPYRHATLLKALEVLARRR